MAVRKAGGALKLDRKLVAREVRALPSFSSAVTRLTALVNDERTTIADFEAVVKLDPGLTADVLKLANSAAFGLRRQVSSVAHAVALLGIQRLFDIAVCAGFRNVLPDRLDGYSMTGTQFWQESVATAVFATMLAESLELPVRGHLFTAGMLHDCGKLVINGFLARGGRGPVLASGEGYLVERERLGMDHAEVGAAVIKAWQLPECIVSVVEHHHEPAKLLAADDRLAASVVNVASMLAEGDLSQARPLAELDQAVVRELSLTQAQLDEVVSRAQEQVRTLTDTLASAA